jgi:hypothetical protein
LFDTEPVIALELSFLIVREAHRNNSSGCLDLFDEAGGLGRSRAKALAIGPY